MKSTANFFERKSVNIDITSRCGLECPNCQRQFEYKDKGLKVPGHDISVENFKKVLRFMNRINFEGQYSDPVHHPKFIEYLKMCRNNVEVEIHNASSQKPKRWYIEAFKANPNAYWVFAIDGLPQESFIYRVNQDGQKLYDIMKESVKYLETKPTWQYIVFSYNENHIDQAIDLANEAGVNFYLLQSARWLSSTDPLMPKNPKYLLNKPNRLKKLKKK